MNITYAPIKKEEIDTIYAFCKKLIDDYEDLDSIDYDKVLAWVKRKIEKRADEYKRVLMGGNLAEWKGNTGYCVGAEKSFLKIADADKIRQNSRGRCDMLVL